MWVTEFVFTVSVLLVFLGFLYKCLLYVSLQLLKAESWKCLLTTDQYSQSCSKDHLYIKTTCL